jgi:ATP-dependent DNA helicase PIF1
MRLLHGCSDADVDELKEFAEWVLGIGDGVVGDACDDGINVHIPDDLLIHSSGDHVASIVECIYPSILHNMNDPEYFKNRAILTPKNLIVEEINNYVMSLIPGEERTYLSCDSPCPSSTVANRPDDVHTPEFLNKINASGLPNHKITLKVGVPVMLLRNLDINAGLCNGTRLIITRMGRYVLEGRVISGSNIGDKVFVPRLSLQPSDTRIPFKFQRRQFPITVCFAMTINKSQGQSLKQVGVYL